MAFKVKIDPVDRKVSEYVRKRSGGCCQKCGSPRGWKGLECCHYIGRGNKSVRYDEDNCIALCTGCHSWYDEDPDRKKEFFISIVGEDQYRKVRMRADIGGKPDKEAIKLYFKHKIKELDDLGEYF